MKAEVFIGVDVCKPRLDVTIFPTGEILEFENTFKGTKQFVKRAKKLKPTLIACEYTGGLEQLLLIACAEANLPIAVVNPKQVRSCSQNSTWRAVRADLARATLDHKMHLASLGQLPF